MRHFSSCLYAADTCLYRLFYPMLLPLPLPLPHFPHAALRRAASRAATNAHHLHSPPFHRTRHLCRGVLPATFPVCHYRITPIMPALPDADHGWPYRVTLHAPTCPCRSSRAYRHYAHSHIPSRRTSIYLHLPGRATGHWGCCCSPGRIWVGPAFHSLPGAAVAPTPPLGRGMATGRRCPGLHPHPAPWPPPFPLPLMPLPPSPPPLCLPPTTHYFPLPCTTTRRYHISLLQAALLPAASHLHHTFYHLCRRYRAVGTLGHLARAGRGAGGRGGAGPIPPPHHTTPPLHGLPHRLTTISTSVPSPLRPSHSRLVTACYRSP